MSAFPTIDVYFYQLVQIIVIYKRPNIACIVKTATGNQCLCPISQETHFLQVSSFLIVFFCQPAPKLIQKFSVQNDQSRKHMLHQQLFCFKQGKQLFNFLLLNLRSFRSCSVYNCLYALVKILDEDNAKKCILAHLIYKKQLLSHLMTS